jgi:hypothetical protein
MPPKQSFKPLLFLLLILALLSLACKKPISFIKGVITDKTTPVSSTEEIDDQVSTPAVDPTNTKLSLKEQTPTAIVETQAPAPDLESLVQRLALPEFENLEPFPNSYGGITEPYFALPQLSIDSDDARMYNRAMKEFAQVLIEDYDLESPDPMTTDLDVRYEAYLNGDLLSIVVESRLGTLNYFGCIKAFNIDIRTGKAIDGFEMLRKFGWAKADVAEQMEALIHTEYENLYYQGGNYLVREYTYLMNVFNWAILYGYFPPVWSPVQPYRGSPLQYLYPEHYLDEDGENSPSVFLDEDGNLVYLVRFFYVGDVGNLQKRMVRDLTPKKAEINPSYASFAQKLGIDPHAEDAPLMLSAFLGHLGSEEEAKTLAKLNEVFTQFGLDKPYLNQVLIKEGANDDLVEVFLLLPKYEAVIAHLDQTYESDQLDDYKSSPTLLDYEPLASSEYGPLRIYFRHQIIYYAPQVNSIDGQNTVPMGIVDFSDLLSGQ